MEDTLKDTRLIEGGFPCHQIGAETQRERDTGQMPATHGLHVWWARRPLIPSRAAIEASLLDASADPAEFVRDLGISKRVISINGVDWTLVDKTEQHIRKSVQGDVFEFDLKGEELLQKEIARRAKNRQVIDALIAADPTFADDPVIKRWQLESRAFSSPLPKPGEKYEAETRAADPAHVNDRISFAKSKRVTHALGETLRWDPEDLYAYSRAYAASPPYRASGLTVLDATAGGGSIPFEALRLGHNVLANELNPVATTILYGTLDFPARFGLELLADIEEWGGRLVDQVEQEMSDITPLSPLPNTEITKLERVVSGNRDLMLRFGKSEVDQNGILYCRVVTCPSCGGEAPLLNSFWLSKVASDQWGVNVVPNADNSVSFEIYQALRGKGPSGEDPEGSTVTRGIGQCVHCRQAITGDEIKAQARGESRHGRWRDRIFAVQAVRIQPKLNKNGEIERYASGARKGEIKTQRVKFYRAPTTLDIEAVEAAERRLQSNWGHWENEDIVPSEKIPDGSKTSEPLRYGMNRWSDMFTPRQLLGHVTLMKKFLALQPEMKNSIGDDRARAVSTYLQFTIDKFVDYNSRQTRWHFSRGIIVGTFGRHDFSLKWTFAEMPYAGPASGISWALSVVCDKYKKISELLSSVKDNSHSQPPIKISNGSATSLTSIQSNTVDLICFDPPYYDNVQYGELSDYYYVWQRRGLRDVYPELFRRRYVDKAEEAVANPARDGSAKKAKDTYERMMSGIFAESRRVLKDDGVMTLMFTHKKQEAWETLTRSLIETGWSITSCMPVESESGDSTHQMNMASAASTIFITCRKRVVDEHAEPALWRGLGGTGVEAGIRKAVRDGLSEFERLKLNPVDEMIASFGRALQVLSENWPVQDDDELVSPVKAMTAASAVVAAHQITKITNGRLSVDDLDTETAMALTVLGAFGVEEFPYDDALNLSRALNIALEGREGGYTVADRKIGVAAERPGATYAAPLTRKGSKLRLVGPGDRDPRRLEKPQTTWDKMHGLMTAWREGQDVRVRAYFEKHCDGSHDLIRDLLTVWRAEIGDEKLQQEVDWIKYALGMGGTA